MKPYPTKTLEFKFDPFNEAEGWNKAEIPTPEALTNFEFYLEPAELEFYEKLSDGEKLYVRMSTNPFNALARAMGRDRP